MASMPDGLNPARPYHVPVSHIPPSIDATVQPSIDASARATSKFDLGSSARDVLSDLDYSDYLTDASPSVLEILKRLIDQGLWKYSTILLAQPFEVAKLVLQTQDAGFVTDGLVSAEREQKRKHRDDRYFSDEDEDDDDSSSYFTSAAATQSTRSRREHNRRRRYSSSRSRSRHSTPSRKLSLTLGPHTKALASTSSLTAVLSSLWSTEGAWGVWKGTNSTFWHSVLLSTITSFLRSFFCAVSGLPDPATLIATIPTPSAVMSLDILSSPSPITSLILAVSASSLASLILSPLDIARTKLMVTPSTHPPRSTLATLSSLGSWGISTSIAHITLLHAAIPTFINASTPLFLRTRLGLDPATNSTTYSFMTILSQILEFSIRLPVETALRRGQLHVARSAIASHAAPQTHIPGSTTSEMHTTIPIGLYKGLWGTWYHIALAEGSRPSRASPATAASTLKRGSAASSRDVSVRPSVTDARKKGQGLEGLYRGWRINAWGLVGMWTAYSVGGGIAASSAGGF